MVSKEIAGAGIVGFVGGLFAGGLLGWLLGLATFYLVEVPKAAQMDKMAADSYLCTAGMALPWLAIPGALVGAFAASFGCMFRVRSSEMEKR